MPLFALILCVAAGMNVYSCVSVPDYRTEAACIAAAHVARSNRNVTEAFCIPSAAPAFRRP